MDPESDMIIRVETVYSSCGAEMLMLPLGVSIKSSLWWNHDEV